MSSGAIFGYMADTMLFLSWDVIWGHNDPRVTALKDDTEGLRRNDQAVEAARRVWESWFLRSMGAAVNYDGAAGRAQVPVDQIGDVDAVRRQIKELLDADVAIGIGLKISEADLALKLALKRGGTVVFYTDDVPKALEDLEKGALMKADEAGPESPAPPAPKKVAENSPAAGGGFSGAQGPGRAAGAAAPASEASEHSQGEGMAAMAEDAPGPQETTHAGADYEKQFQDAADGSDKEEQDQQAQTEDGRKAADLKEAVIQILKGLRQQAPVLEQLQVLEPQLFQAISGLMKAMLMMAKELVGVAPVKKAEDDKIEADPAKPPEASAELVKDAVPDAAQGLDVDHYSGRPDLKTVDPHFQGTGQAGPEKARKKRIPRSYFYARGTRPEAHVAANAHLYHGRIPAGTKLYDFSEDPDEYLAPKWKQTDDGQIYQVPDLNDVEKDLHRRGFHGYRNYGPDGALALFHALPVARATVMKMDDMPALPPPEGNLKSECKHFYGKGGNKCLRCKEEKIEKGKLPLPENAPKHVQHQYPVGAVKDSGPGGTRDVGKVKVMHPETGKTGWVEVRAGQVLSQDGHAISSRNPGGK